MSPDANHKVHWYKHQLPEEIKKKQIQRKKHSCDPSQNQEKIEMKKSDFSVYFFPRYNYRDQTKKKCKDNHYETQPVKSKMQADSKGRNPVKLNISHPFLICRCTLQNKY